MAGKRPYKEILASLETHIIYINNHLRNIDQHLEKLNTGEGKQNIILTKHSERINLIYKFIAGGGLLSLIIGAIALVLKLVGIY